MHQSSYHPHPALPFPEGGIYDKGEGLGGGEKRKFLYNQGTNLKGTFAFTGIHIMNPEVLDYIPENKRYSIIECYGRLIDLRKPIRGYLATGHIWIDIGTKADYLRSNFNLLPPERISIAPECHVDPDATLKDWAVIGRRSSIEKGALVKRSVLWNDVTVRQGIKVVDSVVTSGVIVEKDLVGGVAMK